MPQSTSLVVGTSTSFRSLTILVWLSSLSTVPPEMIVLRSLSWLALTARFLMSSSTP